MQEGTRSTSRKFLSNLSPGLNINFQTPHHGSTRDDGKCSICVQHKSCPKPGPGQPGLVPGELHHGVCNATDTPLGRGSTVGEVPQTPWEAWEAWQQSTNLLKLSATLSAPLQTCGTVRAEQQCRGLQAAAEGVNMALQQLPGARTLPSCPQHHPAAHHLRRCTPAGAFLLHLFLPLCQQSYLRE